MKIGSTARAGCLALLLALLLAPSTAYAHTALLGARPADGDHLAEVPAELRLRFNEPVQLQFARITLVGPDGAAVALGALATHPDSVRVLLAPIAGRLAAGPYTVRWQVAGADGHPVRGEYSFLIAPGAAGLDAPPDTAAVVATVEDAPHDPVTIPEGPGFDAGSSGYVAIRWLHFLGLLGAIGAAVFGALVLPRVARRDPAAAPFVDEARRRAARVGIGAVGVVAAATLLRFLAQSLALHGPDELLDPALARGMIGGTVWGWGWMLAWAGVIAAGVGFAMAARDPGRGWGVAGLGAAILGFVPALSGHAAAMGDLSSVAIAADGLHVLGAGGWMGGLLLLLIVGLPIAARHPRDEGVAAAVGMVESFSPTALLFAGVVVLTGVVSAILHLASLSALWETEYGAMLFRKLVIVAALFAAGAYNWLRVRPALRAEGDSLRLRRTAALELAIGAVVLAVTAVLVATAPTEM